MISYKKLLLGTSLLSLVVSLEAAIVHNEIEYKEVTSPNTGKIWLDRNLGAKEVCKSIDDKKCFGNYYQWGRMQDGHEQPNSRVITTPAKSINNAGKYFINWWKGSTGDSWIHGDPSGQLAMKQWSVTDGSSICPKGFRVPIMDEIRAESKDVNIEYMKGMFKSFLKLPKSGIRNKNGDYNYKFGGIWSNTSKGFYTRALTYDGYDEIDTWGSLDRSAGLNIRCIKN